ncbi:hypothetical protein DFH06DRAFT_1339530 [Mycena polygramma]|nr:hypothetical protein DFH06DRAFT_1339530 [Mycena polygramma]
MSHPRPWSPFYPLAYQQDLIRTMPWSEFNNILMSGSTRIPDNTVAGQGLLPLARRLQTVSSRPFVYALTSHEPGIAPCSQGVLSGYVDGEYFVLLYVGKVLARLPLALVASVVNSRALRPRSRSTTAADRYGGSPSPYSAAPTMHDLFPATTREALDSLTSHVAPLFVHRGSRSRLILVLVIGDMAGSGRVAALNTINAFSATQDAYDVLLLAPTGSSAVSLLNGDTYHSVLRAHKNCKPCNAHRLQGFSMDRRPVAMSSPCWTPFTDYRNTGKTRQCAVNNITDTQAKGGYVALTENGSTGKSRHSPSIAPDFYHGCSPIRSSRLAKL